MFFVLSGCGGALVNEVNSGASGALKASPNSVSFGAVSIGQTASTAVSLVNGGSAPVEITQLNLTGLPFSVVTSSDLPVTIGVGGTYSVNVQFNPAATGTATGQLTVASNASTNGTAVIALTGTGMAVAPALSALSCNSGAMTGSGTEACTVTLSTSAPSGGLIVNLSSSNSAVAVPSSVIIPAGAASAGFTATVSSVATAQAVTMTASASGVSEIFNLQLGAAVPTLSVNIASLAFGSAVVNSATTPQPVTLTSMGTIPVTISGATLSGAGFTASGTIFPVTLNPGQTATLSVGFEPTAAAAVTGQLTITSNSSTGSSAVISLSGTGMAAQVALSALSCSSGTITGAGTDTCTVTLTAAAPSGGLTVNLSSSDSTVTVPSTVIIPVGVASAEFTATVSSVATAQTATITASVGSMFTSYTLQLNATMLALTINPASVAFGNVVVNTPTTQQITLTSAGTAPVTINEITLTGAGFTLSGPALPITLTPNQATTVDISFDPTAVGAATGQLTVTSNASTKGTATVALTGTGTAAPVVAVAVTPATASVTIGATQQFTDSVTGTTNTAVTWTVSGAGCSGSTCGTISPTGLYAAPSAVPSPATVTITATSVSDPSKSASAVITIIPSPGSTYYLAPATAGGSDTNSGFSAAAPWLTPNHSVNCGDVIIAAVGTYSESNLTYNDWGAVSCDGGNNVAWVKCAAFDACKVSISSGQGIDIDMSYWGIQGFEVDGTSKTTACFGAWPQHGTEIHHIIFANDIANGCGQGAFSPGGTNRSAGVDYFAVVGSIAYNSASNSTACFSAIDSYQPVAYDSQPGTHGYFGGNFVWDNVDANPCVGGTPTDGEGLFFDTLGSYAQQLVIDNNISIFNGGRGIQSYSNTSADVYIRHNTVYGNNTQTGQRAGVCGEIAINTSPNTQALLNIAQPSFPSVGCGGAAVYAYWVENGNGTDHVDQNYAYDASGNNGGAANSTGFSYGPNNIFGTSPSFANPVAPGAPNCGSYVSVPACMAQVIANFTPTNAAAKAYGYQIPSSTPTYDPLFPQWLCKVNLPPGLISMGCQTAP
ncbi:MAG TPA: choice-of-anchor D domain-containing protein [Acidobacteriaceae bacterium]